MDPPRGTQGEKNTSTSGFKLHTCSELTAFQPDYFSSPDVVRIRLFRQQTMPAHYELRDGRASDLTHALKILLSNLELDVQGKRIYCSELQARLIN